MNLLPEKHIQSHQLCLVIHDIMLQFLKSGEEAKAFIHKFTLNEAEMDSLNTSDLHILDWLLQAKKFDERSLIIRTSVFPALISDSLHCFFEALQSSKKGKLAITYMLIRKPIQETLYVLESMAIDQDKFITDLSEDPLRLRQKNSGGIEGHIKRIQTILEYFNLDSVLSAEYIAKLRYDKSCFDSFDGICNQSMHLFTEHRAIKTSELNINFIFSGIDSKLSQWDYLYSRLPYLLYYMYLIFELIASDIAPTTPAYLNNMHRRIAANYVLASKNINGTYLTTENEKLSSHLESWLNKQYSNLGIIDLSKEQLIQISENGDFKS